jgi:hypothetical protein
MKLTTKFTTPIVAEYVLVPIEDEAGGYFAVFADGSYGRYVPQHLGSVELCAA